MERVINSKTKLKEINGIVYAFNEDGVYIYKVNKPLSGTYIFGENIDGKTLVGIGKAAFCNCKKLDKLFLPRTISYIHPEAFTECPANVEIAKSYYVMKDGHCIDVFSTKEDAEIYAKHIRGYIEK